MPEIDPFVQAPPRVASGWLADPALRAALRHHLPPDAWPEASALVEEVAARGVEELAPLARRAEANPPRHVPYGPWGHREDRVEVDPAWTALVAAGQEAGAVAMPYERPFGTASRVVQAALLQVLEPHTATALCPLSMTDGVVACLAAHDAELSGRYRKLLLARHGGWTAGQWMTEKEGGSDVGRSGTVATARGDGTWALRGTKWFTSATTADLAVALARPEGAGAGSRGLSLFALELRVPDGGWNGLTVRRLKDKLGTKALPTAELDLDGTLAVPVGGLDRGVPKVASVLTVARLWSTQAAVGTVGWGLALARDYARRREVLGASLGALPVHRRWLATIAAQYEGMLGLALRSADLVGQVEAGVGDEPLARVVVPLAKLSTVRDAVDVTSQLVESFGGAGYLEDSGLPRLLRDVHVQCIWEGTTSVLAVDVLRALRDPAVADAFAADVMAQVSSHPHPATADAADQVDAALRMLEAMMREPDPADARRLATAMARTYRQALLVGQSGWELASQPGGERALAALRLLATRPLVPPPAGLSAREEELVALGRA